VSFIVDKIGKVRLLGISICLKKLSVLLLVQLTGLYLDVDEGLLLYVLLLVQLTGLYLDVDECLLLYV